MRLEYSKTSGVGSKRDQEFDQEFNETLSLIDSVIDKVDHELEHDITTKNLYFKFIMIFFIITNIAIFIIILFFKYKNEKKDKMIYEQSKMASMGEMIGNIAHQWRQPLSIISTGVTGMQMQKQFDTLSDEVFNSTCDAINQNAQYLSKTIDDFRNYIRGETHKKDFYLTDEINSFFTLLEGSIKSNEINIVQNLTDDILINGYQNELTQCLINLFNNSKDAFIENETKKRYIFISTLQNKNYAIIKIKDNAGGIPSHIIKKIFEPYFTTKHQSQGTGLGLHMTYNFIHNTMNGEIKVYSIDYLYNDEIHRGTEFTIKIPLD